ncbi:Putative stomatin/prohibitin-family membrane protease subunit PA4582 [hydrothermal vent metagenome]|uniref:Stomatin/prohibitin-family membrane protease subunit PA4582 n=1 Tax=hydrothermal vent metagenome TaxID=652676 RepID=A0A3B0YKH7_9ZZZZ
MFRIKRAVIAQHERALLLKDRSIVKVLEPGVHQVFDPFNRVEIQVYDLTVPEFQHPYMELLLKSNQGLIAKHFQLIELGDYEVGLVYKNGKLKAVLAPGSRQLYWQGLVDVKVEVLDITQDYTVASDKANLIAHTRDNELVRDLAYSVAIGEIADNTVGHLVVDGKFVKSLSPGLHVYWKFNRNIKIEKTELRLQAVEVQGQEILTKDKVSLRVNLSAQYKVLDPTAVRNKLVSMDDYVYRELQFALRQAVGERTLDVMLSDKESLDKVILDKVKVKTIEFGVEIQGVGVKDIILPGDMKEILNQVVQAEKVAQANVIKRREETSATRSLLNTAKLMDDNPTLLRLKELEVLEKITEKVDKLTVFGGLDGILKDTVQIKVNAD